jgi:hypothetical protein
VLSDHPNLQETKDRVLSINDICEKQVMDGVAITDLTSLNTEKGSTVLTMYKFLDHMVHDKALGKLTAAEKKKSGSKRECRRRTAALGFMLAS